MRTSRPTVAVLTGALAVLASSGCRSSATRFHPAPRAGSGHPVARGGTASAAGDAGGGRGGRGGDRRAGRPLLRLTGLRNEAGAKATGAWDRVRASLGGCADDPSALCVPLG